MNEQELLQQRLERIKDFYLNIDSYLDKIPDELPLDMKDKIRKAILDDKGLKDLIDGIDNHRPPRIFLVGRTGVGKSSLINALCGSYLASVNDTRSCTQSTVTYPIKDGNRILMEICDTRGTKESITPNNNESAEDQLIDDLCNFTPDVAVYVLDCSRRDDIVSDVVAMQQLCKAYQQRKDISLPLIVVLNRCDQVAPDKFKNPSEYPMSKWKNIDKMVVQYSDVFNNHGLSYLQVIPVSSYIEWHNKNGEWISIEEIEENLTREQAAELTIGFDGRVKIEQLYNFLLDAIQDRDAKMGWQMAAKLNEVAKRLAKHLCNIFSSMSGIVGLTPLPGHDIIYLSALQVILVYLIAGLGGRTLTFDEVKAFLVGLLGIGGVGITLRTVAQQLAKFLNGKIPAAGSVLSGFIAASGTKLIGSVAIDYYINELSEEEVMRRFKEGILHI